MDLMMLEAETIKYKHTGIGCFAVLEHLSHLTARINCRLLKNLRFNIVMRLIFIFFANEEIAGEIF